MRLELLEFRTNIFTLPLKKKEKKLGIFYGRPNKKVTRLKVLLQTNMRVQYFESQF